MLDNWVFIGIFLLIAAAFPGVPIAIALLLGPKKPNEIKQSTYECGIETVGETWVQFKVQYYVYALVFLIFDVEIVFLFPWAVAYGGLGLYGAFVGILFILVLVEALFYAWRKGHLEWA